MRPELVTDAGDINHFLCPPEVDDDDNDKSEGGDDGYIMENLLENEKDMLTETDIGPTAAEIDSKRRRNEMWKYVEYPLEENCKSYFCQ